MGPWDPGMRDRPRRWASAGRLARHSRPTYIAELVDEETEELWHGYVFWRWRKSMVRVGVARPPDPVRARACEGVPQGLRRPGYVAEGHGVDVGEDLQQEA